MACKLLRGKGDRPLFTLLLSFCLTLPTYAAPWTKENAPWNINFSSDGSDPSKYYGQWHDHHYFPSPQDWRKVAIYHVMTDRFSDGDPRNNEGKYGGYDPGNIMMRQGGDFAGLTKKLDYIKTLGFDAILVSPIFQNLWNSYHGYGAIDFTLLDDRLGTLEEFRELVSAAHERGMYIIVDIVVNHTSSLFYFEGHEKTSAPFHLHTGEYSLLPRKAGETYTDFRVDNEFDPEGSYCDVYGRDGQVAYDDGKGTFSKSDFHHNGDLTDFNDTWNIHLGQIYGKYNDLRLCSERVQKKIIAMTKSLLASADIDGIRIDTPMQVPLPFFKEWTPAVKDFARTLGKENFFMFGETYASRARAATMIGRGKAPQDYGKPVFISDKLAMDSGIHYGFYKRLVVPFLIDGAGAQISDFPKLLEQDALTYDQTDSRSGTSSYRMINFFNNHDQRRLATFPLGLQKSDAASVLLAFWPGIPMYYYGDEQHFCTYGSALNGQGREPMMSSFAWDKQPAACSPNPALGDSFNMASPSFQSISRIYAARRALSSLLTDDAPRFFVPTVQSSSKALVFGRRAGSGDIRAIVAVNLGAEAVANLEVTLPGILEPEEKWVNILSSEAAISSGKESILKLSLSPFEGKVFVPEKAKIKFPLSVTKLTPGHDEILPTGKHLVSVELSEAVDPESISGNVLLDGTPLLRSKFSVDLNSAKFTFAADLSEGIHELAILPKIRSVSGASPSAAFHARFRIGEEKNALIRRTPWTDPELINSGAKTTKSPEVSLSHHATGARYYRVNNAGSPEWSPWLPYAPTSQWKLSGGDGWKNIAVQYWADGSGAYFVNGGIDLMLPDGITEQNS
jgi:glycosidase